MNEPEGLRVSKEKRGRPQKDGTEVVAALAQVWEASDHMCGKLLAAVLEDMVDALKRHGELQVPPENQTATP